MVCRPRAETQGRGRMVSISMDTRFLNMNRPGLPRITHCPSGGPRESADSRAELGTTPSAGNAHPKSRKSPALSHPKCIWMGLDGLRSPIHPHPKAHPFPSKSRLDGQSGGRDDVPTVVAGGAAWWFAAPRRCRRCPAAAAARRRPRAAGGGRRGAARAARPCGWRRGRRGGGPRRRRGGGRHARAGAAACRCVGGAAAWRRRVRPRVAPRRHPDRRQRRCRKQPQQTAILFGRLFRTDPPQMRLLFGTCSGAWF